MFFLGLILLVLGLVLGIGVLLWIGVALLVLGAILHFAPARAPYGSRGYWY